jgi:hypothetical protein
MQWHFDPSGSIWLTPCYGGRRASDPATQNFEVLVYPVTHAGQLVTKEAS